MEAGTVHSCNAYFAQLGLSVGVNSLHSTAELFGISVAKPNTPANLKDALPQAAYGQGQVVASPFQMARVAATVANEGKMPYGHWVIDESNPRDKEPQPILGRDLANSIGGFMRGVVLRGTGRILSGINVPIAGKTGTAEVEDAKSHSWFVGFAPYGAQIRKRIAFSVLIENGHYGARAAAPAAGEIVVTANRLGLLN